MYPKKCEIFCLSSLLVAGMACGATTSIQETFENATVDGTDLSALSAGENYGAVWTGYGSIKATANWNYAGVAGTPVVGGAEAHTKALQVDGYVTLKPTDPTTDLQPVQVDMMVLATLPDEDLAFPTGETNDSNPIQIAVGVDKKADNADKGDLKVHCRNKSGVAGWYSLMEVTKDVWC